MMLFIWKFNTLILLVYKSDSFETSLFVFVASLNNIYLEFVFFF